MHQSSVLESLLGRAREMDFIKLIHARVPWYLYILELESVPSLDDLRSSIQCRRMK